MSYLYEYRINKKGAECFRTRNHEEAKARLEELNAKRPGIYTMQSRSARLDRHGVAETNYKGLTNWGIWG